MKDFVTANKSHSAANLAVTLVDKPFYCFLTAVSTHQDPCHFKDAVLHEHWVKAMNQEVDALELNDTWEIVLLPPGKCAIGTKWIFKTKFLPDESVDKYKARLVVLGCHQRPGDEYFKTFAPVAKLTTV
ncbi:putative mitochondrial protein AtMg00820 [Apium graveolens]|uniref:putative mitochondrial protein AtMg00820 n=1 Tax=Apium graveolens TaxID=4045 RepID=UPI003D799172